MSLVPIIVMSFLPGYLISSHLLSSCSWTQTWFKPSTSCRLSSLMMGYWRSEGQHQASTNIFPPHNVTIPPLPYLISYGVSGFVDGKPLVCGGADVATAKIVTSCYSLDRIYGWQEETPMIQERFAASSTIIEFSAEPTLWVLGGTDGHDHGLSSSSILRNKTWGPGPSMTSVRAGHCSLALSPTSILITGGLTPHGSTSLVEIFSFSSGLWTSMPSLKQRRERHVCTQVWVESDGTVAMAPGPWDIMAVVVAGGDAYKDASEHSDPVTTVEMFIHDTWIELPPLPMLDRGQMSRPTALHWMPGLGLMLLGGCWIDLDTSTESCTNKIWKLEGGATNYTWEQQKEILDQPLLIGNTDMLLPSNFFNATSTKPTTNTTSTKPTTTTALFDNILPGMAVSKSQQED